jgi:fluoride exporter
MGATGNTGVRQLSPEGRNGNLVPMSSQLRVQTPAPAAAPAAVTTATSPPAPALRWVLVAISCGGVLGALARYGIGVSFPARAGGFPLATFAINATGCFLIGILMEVITERATPHPLIRPFVGVGVLGGFTTFSTYAVDVQRLIDHGTARTGLAYLVATPVTAFLAVWLGLALVRVFPGGKQC